MFHAKGIAMNDLDFAALLVSRVCHDLVSPVGAVVNGLEVLEDETDLAMRADALRLVAASAEQAAARLQFARIAFGAAGSAGAELDLSEVGRIVAGLLRGGKIELVWQACLTYDIESLQVRKLAEEELHLPYLKITTDYSPLDSARISARVEALFETIRVRLAAEFRG